MVSELGQAKISGRKDLPDVDLAIIDDQEQSCLLCELKWFINPSDPREWIEKAEEISKGISQASLLKKAFTENCTSLKNSLSISEDYSVSAVVVTPGWIGIFTPQHEEVAVIAAHHLSAKLGCGHLRSAIDWLDRRQYLPESGKHFAVNPTKFSVGRWNIEWYGIEPIVEGHFNPS